MPSIGRIQSTNFQDLLTSLGITRNQIPFDLRSEVIPVVLVGGTVSFLASPTPAYGVTDIFTAGPLVAPIAGTVLADTGQLPAGTYTVQAFISMGDSNFIQFQWRDVANAASLWTQDMFNIITNVGGPATIQFAARFDVLNTDERFRVIIPGAGGVGVTYQASLLAKI